nr:hypothetical protein [Tanacetum cinerariifolium]
MRDEHLDTISETKSNEFIKFSFENLVPNPSESEDLSDSKCDVPACDDFATFSNLLFDANDDFSSSDNESFSDVEILKKNYSNPLFDEEIISSKINPHHFNAESDLIESLLNHDSSIISSSSKIDSLLDEFAGELILLKTIPPRIDKTDCDPKEEIRLIEKLLYGNSSSRPPEEFNSENSNAAIESFSPSHIPVEDNDPFMKEIHLFLASDGSIPPGIDSDYYDSEGDILILEELLSNDSLSLPEIESFDFDIPSSIHPHAKPPDDDEIEPNSGMLTVKVVGDISEQKLCRLLLKQGGVRSTWGYPFAIACINITFMLTQMLEFYQVKPKCEHCVNFVRILGEDEDAFDVLYCIAFAMTDAQWLATHASFVEFNEALQAVRSQLEKELAIEDLARIRDFPAFNLLHSYFEVKWLYSQFLIFFSFDPVVTMVQEMLWYEGKLEARELSEVAYGFPIEDAPTRT